MPQTFERNQVGKREDLLDNIYNVDAKKTPLLSMIPKGKELVNTTRRWQADAYADPQTDGVVDGADVSEYEDAAANREELEGRVQRLWRTPKTSTMTRVTDVAGQGKAQEFAKAIVKKTAELKRDAECVLGSDNESQDDNGSVPYKTRGLGKWIQATAQSHEPVPEAFRTPSASINTTALASLTPALVNNVMQSQADETGSEMTYALVCGTSLKKTFTNMVGYVATVSNFTAITRTDRGTETAWTNNIQSFTGDFGTYDLILSRWLNYNNTTKVADARRGYALDTDMLSLDFNQPWRFQELPDMGGGRRGLIDVIMMLCVKNPLGLAKFAATQDS
jgi:hypothetical protein